MLVAEELHLLLTDDVGGPVPGAGYRAYAEIAALVVDLMFAGRARIDTDAAAHVHLDASDEAIEELLAAGLTKLRPHDGEPLAEIVRRADLDPWDDIVASLVAKGVLARGRRGLFGTGYSRTLDPGPANAVRTRLDAVLCGRAAASARDAILLSLIHALGIAPRVLAAPAHGEDDAALARRIDEISAGVRPGDVVEEAIVSTLPVVFAAAILPMLINRLI